MASLLDDQSTYLGALLQYFVLVLPRTMASNDSAPAHGAATDDEKKDITGANHVERIETNDNDISLAKVEVDAKLDEFGARSKTNPAEIALVKKLDRTILVSPGTSKTHISTADTNLNSLSSGSCTCKAPGKSISASKIRRLTRFAASIFSTAMPSSTPNSILWMRIWVFEARSTTH